MNDTLAAIVYICTSTSTPPPVNLQQVTHLNHPAPPDRHKLLNPKIVYVLHHSREWGSDHPCGRYCLIHTPPKDLDTLLSTFEIPDVV